MITGITADANNLSTYLLKNLIEYKTRYLSLDKYRVLYYCQT